MESRLKLKNMLKYRRYLVTCKSKQFASIRHCGLFFGFDYTKVYRKVSKWISTTSTDLSKPVVATRIKVKNKNGTIEYNLNIKIHNEEYDV